MCVSVCVYMYIYVAFGIISADLLISVFIDCSFTWPDLNRTDESYFGYALYPFSDLYVRSCRADAAVMSHMWEYIITEEETSLTG